MIIPIKEPMHYAGLKYKWMHQYKQEGVGLPLKELSGTGTISFTIGNSPKVYTIPKYEALAIVKRFNSIHDTKKMMVLGVIPISACNNPPKNQDLNRFLEEK